VPRFEYGYASRRRTRWYYGKRSSGDFANGAEVIIDQFLIAGLAKWGETSRLTLLLPHGYEGQARSTPAPARAFPGARAEGNIRVANCTTPRSTPSAAAPGTPYEIRPLVVMTPKSLLRLPAAASQLTTWCSASSGRCCGIGIVPGPRE